MLNDCVLVHLKLRHVPQRHDTLDKKWHLVTKKNVRPRTVVFTVASISFFSFLVRVKKKKNYVFVFLSFSALIMMIKIVSLHIY